MDTNAACKSAYGEEAGLSKENKLLDGHAKLTPHTENYAMRPKVDRVTFSSNALQYVGEYVGDIILNLLIVASSFALLMFGILLFSS